MSVRMMMQGRQPAAGGSFTPASISGLKLWLDASDSATLTLVGSKVSVWADKSASGYNVSQGTDANRPTRVVADKNGLDTVTFDRTQSQRLSGSGWTTIPQPLTVFCVAKSNTPNLAGTGRILSSTPPGSFQIVHADGGSGRTALVYAGGADFAKGPTDAYASAVWGVSSFVVNGASTTAYVNGVAGTTANAGSAGLETGTVGARADNSLFHDGPIGELIVYNSALSGTDRASVESYLSTKWAV